MLLRAAAGFLALALGPAAAFAFEGMHVRTTAQAESAMVPPFAHTAFPEGLFGAWVPKAPPQSVLGPLAYEFITAWGGAFSAQRDPKTGDVWFTILEGQAFRVREKAMQYCFGYTAPSIREQSPFTVNSTSADSVSFCWREGLPGMQTHTEDCRGCDCAAIRIDLKDKDFAELTFWQSPPVIHAHLQLKRSGAAPTMDKISKIIPTPVRPFLYTRW